MRPLVIGDNAVLVFNVVWALGAAGIESDVISDWHAPRVRYSRHCRRYTNVPTQSLRDLQTGPGSPLRSYCKTHGIDVVIPADLATLRQLALPAARGLPLFPIASAATLELLHDKWRFHELLRSHGLPSPRTQLLDLQLAVANDVLRYPVLVKPTLGEGGQGISRCDSRAQLEALWTQLGRQRGAWLVQEWIDGYDIDLSLLADRGRIVAHTIQRDEAVGKRFVHDERMLALAAELVRVTQFHGLAHFDMRIDAESGELFAIECNPRVWGSLMYSVWAGINFIELGCRIALGEHVPSRHAPSEHVWHQGVAPLRMFKALLHGRTAPEGMTGATLASWRQVHADPWTQLLGHFTEANETRLRNLLRDRIAV